MADAGRPQNVADLRDAIAARLHGLVAQPLEEARELLAAVHDASRSWASIHASDSVNDLLIDTCAEATERRAAGAPMAYAVRRAAFRHLFLHVDERVLIPRPETEELVTLALPHIAPGSTVVDVGTGSGAIALALSQESKASHVIGTDLSVDAIHVAELNARCVLRREYARTEFLHGSLLDPVPDIRIDIIVSNPPYIALGEAVALPAAVGAWEPATALFGGADGMDVIRALVAQAEHRLPAGGMLLMEIDSRRGMAAVACADAPCWVDVQLVLDAFGRDRFLIARRSAATARAAQGSKAGAGLPEVQ